MNTKRSWFRKKPVVIEAIQLFWGNWSKICDFVNVGLLNEGKPEGCYIGPDGKPRIGYETQDKIGLLIPTLERPMLATEGDWIIRGVKGEFYPCKPDIFEMTYEPVDAPTRDDIFIRHIQGHLQEGQEVICTICRKTARAIIEESLATYVKEEVIE